MVVRRAMVRQSLCHSEKEQCGDREVKEVSQLLGGHSQSCMFFCGWSEGKSQLSGPLVHAWVCVVPNWP